MLCISIISGYVGNGSQCDEPPRIDSGFLLLSRGLSAIRVPFSGQNSRPILMSHVSILPVSNLKQYTFLFVFIVAYYGP